MGQASSNRSLSNWSVATFDSVVNKEKNLVISEDPEEAATADISLTDGTYTASCSKIEFMRRIFYSCNLNLVKLTFDRIAQTLKVSLYSYW